MTRVGWLLLVIVVAAGGAVAAVPRPPLTAALHTAAELAPVEDPFPIRRVRGNDSRLPALLKELDAGPVVRLPRGEFESRVRAASRAVAVAKHAPRVVDATYTAELDGGELTGTAEFGILNTNGSTSFVPLDPLRLAVRSAKWADGGDAILAVPAGASSPAVWMDRDGRRVLQLGWSLTGTTEPGERRFELRVPACPTSVLELNLPAAQLPTASSEVLLTGPFPISGQSSRRLWRLRFGGRSKVEFAIRAVGDSGSIALAKLAARYDLSPGQLTATFEYELRPARGSVGEWSFTADPGMRITDVVTNNRAGWTVDPPATPNGPRRVRVSLRQPGPGGKVLISAVAPFPDPSRSADSPLPTVRPLDAVLDDERLELRVASSLKIDGWNVGHYRLVDAAPAMLPISPATTFRMLSLVGSLLPPNADEPFRRMPSVGTSATEADFTTFERLEWTLAPVRSLLVARVEVRVRRGPLFYVAVRPPPGFVLDRDAVSLDEVISHVGDAVGGVQVVEFARPLTAGQRVLLRLEFRGPGAKAEEPVPFPAFAVNAAAERDGWLSIAAAPEWAVPARPGAGAARGGLWAWFTTDSPADARSVYLFRGKEPEGTATLVPATPAVNADAVVHVDTAGGNWTATTRIALTATGGALPTLAVFVPGAAQPREWKLLDDTNTIAEAKPIPRELVELASLLLPRDLPTALVGVQAREHLDGTFWVLRFARPLAGNAVLETTATGSAVDRAAVLPVVCVVGANQTTRAEPAPALKDRAVIMLNGSRVIPVLSRGSGPLPVSDAYLVTMVRGPEEVIAAFGGTVHAASGGTVRVQLPEGAEVRGVCVAGRWLNPAACAERDSRDALPIPIPAGPATRFEVRYRLPVASTWPTRSVHSPVPQVVGSEPEVRRWWAFAAGTLPGWPARPWDATAEEPPLLGGPLASGEPVAIMTHSDDPAVHVGTTRTADASASILACGLVVVGLVAVRRRRVRGALILCSVVVIALLVTEVGPPWWARVAWPPLVAATAALAVVLAALGANRRAAAPAVAAAVVSLLLFMIFSFSAVAQSPTSATVLILTDTEGKEEVVAPRSLLNRLDALAAPPRPPTVVTAAEYDLAASDSGARVTAKLVVHAFRDSDNAVSLPFGDARLERVTVNGKRAFPTAPRPDTYTVALPGPGRHEVELLFAVTVSATGPERELRFGLPEVSRSKLNALLPAAARQPQVVGRVGRQLATTGGNRTTLEADIGAAKSLHLRWREGAGGAAVVKVREACIWDVSEAGADLTAAYLVRVEQGTVAGLRFDVPAELEVRRVAARTLDAPAAPIPLRDWSLAAKGKGRHLSVDFQNPTTGRLLLVLECSPRKPITRQPTLRFPRISFGNVTGDTEAVYALRTSRLSIDNVALGGVIDFPPDALRDFATVPDLRLDPNTPVRVFRPVPGGTPELRPAFRVGEPVATRTATTWQVGPHRADATGSVSWSSKEPLPLVEFTLSGVKVQEVRGAEVAGWNQSGSRVQVWLRFAAREGTVEWMGTATPAPPGKPLPDPLPFDPARPRVVNARTMADEIRIRSIEGWTATVDRARGWLPMPFATDLRFRTDTATAPELRLHLLPTRATD